LSNSTQQSQPPQAAVDQVIGFYNQGQLKQTVLLAESLSEQYPNKLLLFEILGASYMGLKNADKTIASYEKVLQLNPNHTDAHNNMGMAFYDQGKFDKAVESYKEAIKLEPDFADAHYNLGSGPINFLRI
jgi:tetratricopeptide (TPR) repeat protein